MGRLSDILFPVPERKIRYIRPITTALRTAHIVSFALLLGMSVEHGREELAGYWAAAGASGVLLCVPFVLRSGAFVVQGAGLAVWLKLGLLALAWAIPERTLPILIAVTIVASVSSHMPGKYRHWSPVKRFDAR